MLVALLIGGSAAALDDLKADEAKRKQTEQVESTGSPEGGTPGAGAGGMPSGVPGMQGIPAGMMGPPGGMMGPGGMPPGGAADPNHMIEMMFTMLDKDKVRAPVAPPLPRASSRASPDARSRRVAGQHAHEGGDAWSAADARTPTRRVRPGRAWRSPVRRRPATRRRSPP